MSMNMNSKILRKMADALDSASKAPYDLEQMRVDGHGMKVRKVQMGSNTDPEYVVIGITTGEFSGSHGQIPR
jgi:hypothetical protein